MSEESMFEDQAEYVEKKGEVSMLKLEIQELEAQIKLRELKAVVDRTIINEGTGFDRLKQSADILCELLDFTPGTEEEISRKVEELRGDTEWYRDARNAA